MHLLNILINALQAIEGQGTIDINLVRDNEHIVLIIKDTGKGIPEEQLPKIFNPFYTTKETGTGIGLALVKRNLMMLGYEVSVHSKVGEGTRFSIRL